MLDRIAINTDVCHGRPCVTGTRITVDVFVGLLAGGDTIDDVLADYPQLSVDDIDACIAYAQRVDDAD